MKKVLLFVGLMVSSAGLNAANVAGQLQGCQRSLVRLQESYDDLADEKNLYEVESIELRDEVDRLNALLPAPAVPAPILQAPMRAFLNNPGDGDDVDMML